MNLWSRIKELEGEVLQTPDQWKNFEVLAVAESELIVLPTETNIERPISREDIEAVFFDLTKKRRITLKEIQTRYKSINASYIIALLGKHPHVLLDRKPVCLRYNVTGRTSIPQGTLKDPSKFVAGSIKMEEGVCQYSFLYLFDNVWERIQGLTTGTSIKNWTQDKGYLEDEFYVSSSTQNQITFNVPAAKNLQVVPKNDFEAIWKIWSDYKNGKVMRSEIRDQTRYSKYVISVFRHLEDNMEIG